MKSEDEPGAPAPASEGCARGALDRRDLIRTLAGVAALASPLGRAASALAIPGPPPAEGSGPSRAVVALARREGMLGADGAIDPKALAAALDAAVARATGEPSGVDGLRRLFKPKDVVGIKVNCIAGRGLSTRPEVAHALAGLLQKAGLPAERIVIWDRTARELRSAGYTVNAGSGVRVLGTDGEWEEKVREWGPAASRFSRLLVNDLTAVIDLPILKDHGMAGVSVGLKNWYGVVHNPNKLHAEGCNPFVPHLAAAPEIRGKWRLTVVDAVTAQCHGGPSYAPAWAWPYQGILASTDKVACDAIGWQLLEQRRKEKGLGTIASQGREPRFVKAAEGLGLGVADPARIEVAKV